jgi:hypothetical protein
MADATYSAMQRQLRIWLRIAFLAGMTSGSLLISAMSVAYFDFDSLPPFVIEKLPLRFETLWLVSLRVHVLAAAISFPLCLASLTRAVQRRVALHRVLGRIAGIVVLFGLLPSGAVLSLDAKGGPFVSAGFLFSASIVAYALFHGVRAARCHLLVAHARAMRHVVAQMSVAVSSRALIVGFDSAGIDPEVAYVIALWVPVLASALLAELLSPSSGLRASCLVLIERIRREISSFALVVRVRALVRPVPRLGR